MEVGEFSRRRLCTGLRLDYILRLWAATSASRAISVIAELLVLFSCLCSFLLFALLCLYSFRKTLLLGSFLLTKINDFRFYYNYSLPK